MALARRRAVQPLVRAGQACAEQNLDNWFTPPAFNEGDWSAGNTPAASTEQTHTHATIRFQNTSATQFHMDLARTVKLLENSDLAGLLGKSAAEKIAAPGVKHVAYETDNRLTNQGDDMTREKGLVSIWILGMMNCGPQTVVIAPYKPGSEADLGPVVKSDYFGAVPADRLKTLPEAVLLRADGNHRSKIGVSQRRVRNVLGSIDFQNHVLTLAQFSMPADPARELYMNNQWGGPLAEPYRGDVACSYNDGPFGARQAGARPVLRNRVALAGPRAEARPVALAPAPHDPYSGRR